MTSETKHWHASTIRAYGWVIPSDFLNIDFDPSVPDALSHLQLSALLKAAERGAQERVTGLMRMIC